MKEYAEKKESEEAQKKLKEKRNKEKAEIEKKFSPRLVLLVTLDVVKTIAIIATLAFAVAGILAVSFPLPRYELLTVIHDILSQF